MSDIQHETEITGISDEAMVKHIAWCGVLVAVVALGIAWVANNVG